MRILLVRPKECEKQKPCVMPPLGLWSIRTYHREHEFVICDEHAGDSIFDALRKKFDRIGISAQFSTQDEEYRRLCDIARWHAPVAAGGPHAAFSEVPPGVDVCPGLGEGFFGKPVFYLRDIPMPQFSTDEIQRYLDAGLPHNHTSKTDRWMSIETSRGCNNSCGYCAMPGFWGKWDGRDPKDIELYLDYLAGHDIHEVFIEDDAVNEDEDRFIELIKAFQRRCVWWSCPNGLLAHKLTDRVLRELEGSTCWRLSLPIETASEKTATLMGLGRKWVPPHAAAFLAARLREMGIQTCGFFVVGYPGESMEDIQRTASLSRYAGFDQSNVYAATPYPGTRLESICKRKGLLVGDGVRYTEPCIQTDQFGPEDVKKAIEGGHHAEEKES